MAVKKDLRGRKKYKDAMDYVINIQIYRKAKDIEIIGGLDKAREITGNAFDKALEKCLKN